MNHKHTFFFAIIICFIFSIGQGHAQGLEKLLRNSQVSGNFQFDGMYYNKDSLIGAPDVPQKVLMNAFANINYTNGPFSAGFRFENYLYALQGFDPRYKGIGIPYRYASFEKDKFTITIGNSYDQFGSGLVYRAWQDASLGYDNSLDGINIKVNPWKGITLKGVWGQQRFYFDKGPGIVRGGDAEFVINDMFKKLNDKPLRVSIGGSFVSKYQDADDPVFNLPKNVAAYGGRGSISYKGFMINGEYAHKINDPSTVNNRIYKSGNATLLQLTYAQKGLGLYLAAIRTDNMSFKSDRDAEGNDLNINYIPSLAKQTTYSLPSIYTYGTQPNGEFGMQAQGIYTFKKKSVLGGKYGTNISLTYSRYNAINKKQVDDDTPIDSTGTLGYKSDYFKIGKEAYYENFNFEFSKKFNKTFKLIVDYFYIMYNAKVIEGHEQPNIHSHTVVVDMTFNINEKHSLRTELQHMYAKQGEGSWAYAMVEYTIAPKWFFSVSDMYNYGNSISEKRLHYYSVATAFAIGSTRISLNYGRQRAGIFCVGGVCRYVPAANGLTLSISSSF
ncbi:MAG TPA: DUF6029 family protein [Bacteroidales bacterium]|nr:DUF6029 family protein [Bacteroidales bacterium]